MANPAAPAFPANLGGDRQILADPVSAGVPTALGDTNALLLRMLHIMTMDPAAAERGAAIQAVADSARQVLAAADASRTREQDTRELRPVTAVPAEPYGVNTNIGVVRLNGLTFNGENNNPSEVFTWLSKILNLAENHTLTFGATINLMIQSSGGSVTTFIHRQRTEGRTLPQIVQQLEMRYGNLCSPEEARLRCNTLPRKEGEGLPSFLDRLGNLAKMACCNIAVADRQKHIIYHLLCIIWGTRSLFTWQ